MPIVRGKFDPAREAAFGSITSSFTMIGTPFAANFYIFWVQNLTNQIIDFSISFDGADKTFSLAPTGTFSSDMFTNSIQISKGEAVWCKYRGVAPSSGFVQLAAIAPAQ